MLFVWAVLGMVAAAYGDGHVPPEGSKFSYCRGTALYKVSFEGKWTADGGQSHEFPGNAMFSPLTFASHNEQYTMWRPMRMAGEGVTDVAETGSNAKLLEELEMYKDAGNVYDIQTSDGPVGASAMHHEYVRANTEFHFISWISMVFPSPDWFIGVYNLDMCVSDTAQWIGKRTIYLYAWDAGTDSGKNFTAGDYPTNPAEYITLLMNTNDPYSSFQITDPSNPMAEYIPAFGSVVFERINVTDGDRPMCQAEGQQNYHVRFQGQWNAEDHPRDFPDTASFSPLVVAGHSSDYHMWSPGMMSTPGVQTVAETGNPMTLQTELGAQGAVLDHMTASGPVAANATMQTYVDVDKDHPYISAITMIFPSPDWFVGISGAHLCDEYFWKDGPIIFRLLPWDAGTDNGTTFMSANSPNPHEGISLITTDTMGAFYNRARQHIAPLGTITLERKKDAQRDYQNLLTTWKRAFHDFQDQFEQWKNDECPSN